MAVSVIILAPGLVSQRCATGTDFRFSFGSDQVESGWTQVLPTQLYAVGMGFGFEPGAEVRQSAAGVAADQPFMFSVKVPEGNYAVTATFGDDEAASVMTVKAELRRLMLEQVPVEKGGTVTRRFVVNVRTPQIPGGGEVRLKPRERESEKMAWDDKLTLEFNGTHPSLRTFEIVPADVPTVFVIGDSTVCDQPTEPWNSWGQMLPRFFKPEIAIANHAESGESIRGSLGARRFDKIFSLMRPGDWLFIQFGHNDMKDRATNALATYKANLKRIVVQTREKGGSPVLVTSMERKAGVERDTLDGYPDAVREVSREDNVALIDLHAMSKVLYRALGEKLDQAFQDGTHHNNYGSYELARCVVEGIRENIPALAAFLTDDAGKYDPKHPDDPDQFKMAVSPRSGMLKPEGN